MVHWRRFKFHFVLPWILLIAATGVTPTPAPSSSAPAPQAPSPVATSNYSSVPLSSAPVAGTAIASFFILNWTVTINGVTSTCKIVPTQISLSQKIDSLVSHASRSLAFTAPLQSQIDPIMNGRLVNSPGPTGSPTLSEMTLEANNGSQMTMRVSSKKILESFKDGTRTTNQGQGVTAMIAFVQNHCPKHMRGL